MEVILAVACLSFPPVPHWDRPASRRPAETGRDELDDCPCAAPTLRFRANSSQSRGAGNPHQEMNFGGKRRLADSRRIRLQLGGHVGRQLVGRGFGDAIGDVAEVLLRRPKRQTIRCVGSFGGSAPFG